MAYVSESAINNARIKLKEIANRYGIKLTVAGKNSSTLKVTILQGKLDFISNTVDCIENLPYGESYPGQRSDQIQSILRKKSVSINTYHFKDYHCGICLECLEEIIEVINQGNHNNSDISTDYFDVGWYTDVSVGRWDKPYVIV